jgi:hypothetical protein
MPTLDLSDEEAQQLTLILANASGPGISWMMTNNLLTKLQAVTQAQPSKAKPRRSQQDGLDLVGSNAMQEH